MVRLDIYSDPICPWCYIGKTLFDAAIHARPDHPFTVSWQPFQLNPEMPAEGMDRRAYLETKFGGKAAAAEVYARIDQAAQGAGLQIDWARIARTPNTLNAHRLIHWAGIEGGQSAVVHALFAAYFEDGRDIGESDVLADIAGACGMERDVTARLLKTDADLDDIRARDADARARGLYGVPTFIVANQHVLPGAQPTELWVQAIDEITTKLAAPDGGA